MNQALGMLPELAVEGCGPRTVDSSAPGGRSSASLVAGSHPAMTLRESKSVRWLIGLAKNSPWLMMAVGLHVILAAVMSVAVIRHEWSRATRRPPDLGRGQARADPGGRAAARGDRPQEDPGERGQAELVTYEEETTFVPTEESRGRPLPGPRRPDRRRRGLGGHDGRHRDRRRLGRPLRHGHSLAVRLAPGRRTATRAGTPPQGATVGTEEAVLEGLRWLMRHQNEDGSWSPATLRAALHGEDALHPRRTPRSRRSYDEGLTGLALLCFLGQGITARVEDRDRRHGHGQAPQGRARSSSGACRWLIEHQKEDGSFCADARVHVQRGAGRDGPVRGLRALAQPRARSGRRRRRSSS